MYKMKSSQTDLNTEYSFNLVEKFGYFSSGLFQCIFGHVSVDGNCQYQYQFSRIKNIDSGLILALQIETANKAEINPSPT